jgi:hypothetical protein
MSAAKQAELALLSYSVGDWVWAKCHGKSNPRVFLARIESATPIRAANRDRWLVRCYRSADGAVHFYAAARGWQRAEHREVSHPLNAKEVAEHRKAGVIPPLGKALP